MRTPTIQELQNSIISAFEDRFGTINRGLRSVFRTIAQVLSGELRLLYLTSARVQKNIFPDLADTEANGGTLERFGRARLGRDPFPATQGIYLVDVTKDGADDAIISAGTTFKSLAGFLYSIETAQTITGAIGDVSQITVRSLTPGLEARLVNGDTLIATAPILNLNQNASVNQETTAPLNAETTEAYREAILQSFRTESQGGASGDYRIWSGDAQGVRTVYPYAGDPGVINIYVEANISDSTDGLGTPSQTILDNVRDVVNQDPDTTKSLNERGRLPLGIFQVNYLAISTVAINISVSGYTGNVTEGQATIQAALVEYFRTIRPYIPGSDPVDMSRLTINRVIGVIQNSVDAEFGSVILSELGVEFTIRQFLNGDIPVVGTVSVTA